MYFHSRDDLQSDINLLCTMIIIIIHKAFLLLLPLVLTITDYLYLNILIQVII